MLNRAKAYGCGGVQLCNLANKLSHSRSAPVLEIAFEQIDSGSVNIILPEGLSAFVGECFQFPLYAGHRFKNDLRDLPLVVRRK